MGSNTGRNIRFMKVLGITLIIVLIASIINHRNQLKKETRAYPPLGSRVNVNDKNYRTNSCSPGYCQSSKWIWTWCGI